MTRAELGQLTLKKPRLGKTTSPSWTPAVIKAARSAMWSRVIPPLRPDARRIHVSGHTPMTEVGRPLDGIIRIDTGCVYGKRLTAYCLEADELLSVPSETKWKQQA